MLIGTNSRSIQDSENRDVGFAGEEGILGGFHGGSCQRWPEQRAERGGNGMASTGNKRGGRITVRHLWCGGKVREGE
ncbi:hypothetical protein HAX54_017550 [Datura stramonium]|uniref:Uncharacterized protein n=1 Tax=Datura stramonium TaxID=4076 RepID=A0ABS8UN78_DATST|nr:hypothetical protein [Datura stramonium]